MSNLSETIAGNTHVVAATTIISNYGYYTSLADCLVTAWLPELHFTVRQDIHSTSFTTMDAHIN